MSDLKIPNHIAIIMDGNGRWAKAHGKVRIAGHEEGANALLRILDAALDLKVPVMSVYAFSTENFNRPKKEVDFLMGLFFRGIKQYMPAFIKKRIKLVFSGREKGLSKKLIDIKSEVIQKTADGDALTLNICLNYGAQYEVLDMVNSLIKSPKKQVELEDLYQNLYQSLPPVDLLIRTSGEKRLSNFMLFQLAYAELYFTKTLWPDFDKKSLKRAIKAYNLRDRRFGGLNEKTSN